MRQLIILTVLVALMAGAPAKASNINDLSGLYDRQTLQYWGERYKVSTGKILDRLVAPALLSEERRALGTVQMSYPMPGEAPLANAPFGYYSISGYGGGQVVFPVLSLKLLDDLCTAYAWLEVHGYSLETISDYIAMLKYNQNLRSLPPVLPTLGIPADALSETEVEQLARSHFVTARAFILAHELGHIRFHHRGSSIANEKQADAFAAEVIERTGLQPLGIMVFFMADAQMADYPPARDATHPLSAARLRALAARLSDHALASKIAALGDYLADPDIQASIIAVGKATSPADLKPRRPGAPATLRSTSEAIGQAFAGRFVGQFTQFAGPGDPSAIVVILRRDGNRVAGEYSFGLGVGQITDGTISGDTLHFAWEWGNNYGHGALRATENGAGFEGSWGYRESLSLSAPPRTARGSRAPGDTGSRSTTLGAGLPTALSSGARGAQCRRMPPPPKPDPQRSGRPHWVDTVEKLSALVPKLADRRARWRLGCDRRLASTALIRAGSHARWCRPWWPAAWSRMRHVHFSGCDRPQNAE